MPPLRQRMLEDLRVTIHFVKEHTTLSPDSRSSDKLNYHCTNFRGNAITRTTSDGTLEAWIAGTWTTSRDGSRRTSGRENLRRGRPSYG
jgi:hypothetical protein